MVAARSTAKRPAPLRKRDSARTKRTILEVAFKEFAHSGYGGARIERIAKAARCNIRMLYHYFGNKRALYVAVLENAYEDIRRQENALMLEEEDPLEGMQKLLRFTFNHFAINPQFVGLLQNENMMRGRFVLRSAKITHLASPLRHALQVLLKRGQQTGVFRRKLDPVQVYVTIAALSWFHLSNAYTLSSMFGQDLTREEWRRRRLEHACDFLRAYLTSDERAAVPVARPRHADPRSGDGKARIAGQPA